MATVLLLVAVAIDLDVSLWWLVFTMIYDASVGGTTFK